MPAWNHAHAFEGLKGCGCRGGGFGGSGATKHYPPSLELEPVHTKINLFIDIQAESAAGSVTQRVVAHRAGAQTLELDAIGFLDVSVTDPGGQALRWTYQGKQIQVTWEKPFALGEERQAEVKYRVEKPRSGLFFMRPTKESPNKATYAATDHETELARYWLPCIDLPNVRTTLEFHLRAAESLTILANGKLVGEKKHGDGTKTAEWRLEQRCPSYLVCFAIGDFTRFDDGDVHGVPLAYFAAKEFSPKDLERTFGRTRKMMEWMTKKLGLAFPFPKYYQFALPAFGGAMENISLVSWSDRFICDEARAAEVMWLTDQVNVHEMAHSYFGDLVVCRDFAHAWLKESWATYMETCWLEDAVSKDEQLYDLHVNAEAYFGEADQSYTRPLVTREFTSSWQMYDRHLYPGGACRLHTIRSELGDECFWAGVRDYLKTYSHQVVETDDFRRMLEKHSGRSLQKLFDQWVMTPGYPKLKVEFSYDADKKLGSFVVTQHQDAPFEITTDLGWTIDGKDHLQAVRIKEARQSFHLPMAKEPEQVRFDPGWKVLHKLSFEPGDGRLTAQLNHAKDVTGRIQAAKALCESGKRANVKAVLAAYPKEKFWGARREMLKALAASQTEEAVVGLAAIVGSEKEPLVLDRIFDSVEGLRDERLTAAVLDRVAKKDLPPRALAAALLALGRHGGAKAEAVLKQHAKTDDKPFNTVQAAAIWGLGRLRKEDLLPELLEASRLEKTSFRARSGAIHGLAALFRYADRKTRKAIEERFEELLRDPEAWTRQTAAKVAGDVGLDGLIPALEAYRSKVSLQEQVPIDATIETLRKKNDKPDQPDRQLEELQAKYRKLHDRLQDLEDKMASLSR